MFLTFNAWGAPDIIYTAEGRIHYEVAKGQPYTLDTDFKVCVSNCLWSITTIQPDPTGGTMTTKQVYDGKVVTCATLFPAEVTKLSTSGNDSTLGIQNTDIPNCLPIGSGQLWLAYCSACKLSGATKGPLEPVWFIEPTYRLDRFTTPAAWEVAKGQPFLPLKVDFFFDPDSFDNVPDFAPQPLPGQMGTKGNVWCSYRATAWTNVGSLVLPESFEFEVFSAIIQGSVKYAYRGQLTNGFESLPVGAFNQGIGTKTLVNDERFVSPSYPAAFVRYVTTNKTLPGTNEPAMLAAAARAKISQFLGAQQVWRPGNLEVLFFIIAALTFALSVFMLARKKRAKTKVEHSRTDCRSSK